MARRLWTLCARRGFYGSARVRRRQCASDASIKRSRPFLVHITRPLSICLRGRRPCLSCRKAGSGQQAARTFGPCRHQYTRSLESPSPSSASEVRRRLRLRRGGGGTPRALHYSSAIVSSPPPVRVMFSVIFACPVYYRPAARSKSRAAAVTCAPARLRLQPPELLAI